MRAAMVALIVKSREGSQSLVEVVSDEREISVLELAVAQGDLDPLKSLHDHRLQQRSEDGEFADYVEDLLSHPFQKLEIREHGLQWLKSKMRIEQYQKSESEAASIIARYAFDVFAQDPEKTDFFLAGPTAQVRIRVFIVPEGRPASAAA